MTFYHPQTGTVPAANRHTGEPYLTIQEAAELLRLTPHGLRNKIYRKVFKRGVHYFKREGQIGVRFKRAALVAWLEEGDGETETITMARGYRLGGKS